MICKTSKESSHKHRNLIILLLSIGILLFALCTLHDLQTAEGVGLYLSILTGAQNHRKFDILTDVIGILLLLISLLAPCIIFRHRSAEGFFHMTALYLAFIPVISPASTVHLVDTCQNLSIQQTFADNTFSRVFVESLSGITDIFLLLIPLLLLFLAINRRTEPTPTKGWKKIVVVLELGLLILNLLFPPLSQEISYFMCYALVIWIFEESETLCRHFPAFSSWGNILYGGCLLRGIYKMIELMSITHL